MSNWTLQIGLQSRKRLIPWERATCGCRCESSRWQYDRQDAECVAYSRRQLDPRTSDFLNAFISRTSSSVNLNSDPKTDLHYSISSGESRNPSAAL